MRLPRVPSYGKFLIVFALVVLLGSFCAAGAGPQIEYEFDEQTDGWSILGCSPQYDLNGLVLTTTDAPARLSMAFAEPLDARRYTMLEIRMAVIDQRLNGQGSVQWSTALDTSQNRGEQPQARSFRIPPHHADDQTRFVTRRVHLGANWQWTDRVTNLTLTPIDRPGTVYIDYIRLYKATPIATLRTGWQDFLAQNRGLQHSVVFLLAIILPLAAIFFLLRRVARPMLQGPHSATNSYAATALRVVLVLWVFVLGYTAYGHYNAVVDGQQRFGGLDRPTMEIATSDFNTGLFARFLKPLLPPGVPARLDCPNSQAMYVRYRLNYLLYPKRVLPRFAKRRGQEATPEIRIVLDPSLPPGQMQLFSRPPAGPVQALKPGEDVRVPLQLPANVSGHQIGRLIVGLDLSDPSVAVSLPHLKLVVVDKNRPDEEPVEASCQWRSIAPGATGAPFEFTHAAPAYPRDRISNRPLLPVNPQGEYSLHLSLDASAPRAVHLRPAANGDLVLGATGVHSRYVLLAMDNSGSNGAIYVEKSKFQELSKTLEEKGRLNNAWQPLFTAYRLQNQGPSTETGTDEGHGINSSTLGTIFGLVYALAVGYCALSLIRSRTSDTSCVETLATAFPLGLGMVTLVAFFESLLGIKLSLLVVAAPWVPLFLFYLYRLYRFVDREEQGPTAGRLPRIPLSWMEKACVVIIAFGLLVILLESMSRSVWTNDAIANWAFKGKAFLYNRGVHAEFLKDPAYPYMHPEYPLNVPLAQTWLHLWMGVEPPDDWAIQILCFGFYASVVGLFYAAVRRWTGRARALAFTALLAITPTLLAQASGLMADVPAATYYLGCILYLLVFWRQGGKREHLILAAVFAGLGAWTKSEGGAFLLIVCLVLVLRVLVRGFETVNSKFKALAIFVVLAFLIATPWKLFQNAHGIGDDMLTHLMDKLNAEGLGAVLQTAGERLPTVSAYLTDMLAYGEFGLFWPALTLVAIVSPLALLRKDNWALSLILLAWIGFVLFTYLVTHQDFVWHMNFSLDRLLVQILPIGFVLLAFTWPKAPNESTLEDRSHPLQSTD